VDHSRAAGERGMIQQTDPPMPASQDVVQGVPDGDDIVDIDAGQPHLGRDRRKRIKGGTKPRIECREILRTTPSPPSVRQGAATAFDHLLTFQTT
jgi:hypothetical protein